jgi:hypothetical protein
MKKKPTPNVAPTVSKKPKSRNRFPKGWDERKVRELAAFYENQSDEEAAAEDDAAYSNARVTMMAVPVELVPKVQKLIAKQAG